MPTHSLRQKLDLFEHNLKREHLPTELRGLALPTLVKSAEGKACDALTGNHENVSIWNGCRALAKMLLFKQEGGTHLDTTREILAGMQFLQEVTGQQGLIARSFKSGDAPTWDEHFFWHKKSDKTRLDNEWHQRSDGIRWLGDASKSQVFGATLTAASLLLFGNLDGITKKVVAEYFCPIVDRILESNGHLIDPDGKVTGYGNYNPKKMHFGFGGIGPQLMLTNLKLAALLTQSEKRKFDYQEIYDQRIKSGHLNLVDRPRVNPPILKNISTAFGSDDNLAILNTFLLALLDNFSGNANISTQDTCKRALANRWRLAASPENALFSFIYHGMNEKIGQDSLRPAILAMENFSEDKTVNVVALKAKNPKGKALIAPAIWGSSKPLVDWPKEEYAWRWNPRNPATWENALGKEGIPGHMQFTGIDYMLAYAIGRYYKILD